MLRCFVVMSLSICVFSSVSRAQNPLPSKPQEPEITTSGRGEVRLAPDLAYVVVGVTTQSQSAIETASENARRIAAIINALRALGLTDQQVRTAGYSLSQVYEYPKNQEPKLKGFTARNTLRAEVRHLEDVGKAIDAAISSGATDVSSIQFSASNTEEARRTALSDAVRQARNDADAMARAAGGTLGRLISVASGGVAIPGNYGYQSAMLTSSMSPAPPPTPIVPGELSVIAQVSTRWEFLPATR
jgi:uncharacterized protein YggE